MPKTILLVILTTTVACRSIGNSQELASLESDTCPENEGFGLLGSESRQKVTDRISDFKTLAGQCSEVARKNFSGLLEQQNYVCSCLKIGMEAFLFAEREKEALGHHSDKVECLRHCHWQAQMTCRWSQEIASDLADVREEDSRSAQDSERDQYHNRLGRSFMSQHDDLARLKGLTCYNKATAGSRYILASSLCASYDSERKVFIFAEEAEINEAYQRFAN